MVRVDVGAGPFALGIHVAHDASVAICSPRGVVFAIQEERLSRIKHHYGFPERALRAALDATGLSAGDFSAVAFPTVNSLFPEAEKAFSTSLAGDATPIAVKTSRDEAAAHHAGVLERLPAQWDGFKDRHQSAFSGKLADLGLLGASTPHFYVHHHRAHAASAFRISDIDRAAIVTADGKGDKIAVAIFKGHPDGRMELVRQSAARNSVGSMYQAVTEALGFIPVDGEYKTMGLAAVADGPAVPNPFAGIISVEDGCLRSDRAWHFRDFNAHNPTQRVANPLGSVAECEDFRPLLENISREVIARSVQEEAERVLIELADSALRITGERNLVMAGGVALNVKANARIRDTVRPDNHFIYPDSADSGLAAGAAMEALYQLNLLKGRGLAGMPDLYVGSSYALNEIHGAVQAAASREGFVVEASTPETLVEALTAGRVLGTFQGRMEMGPRALGNRSVIADPRHIETKDRINRILKGREWFVPFAPVLLPEEARRCWDGDHTYRYMTFSVEASAYARDTLPTVVHVDGSMRPQVTDRERNPWMTELLTAFRSRTGAACLTNTSFNRHGLPIVESPENALEHLSKGWVDGVAIGDLYVSRTPNDT